MAINRNFLVNRGVEVGLNANAGNTWTTNSIDSNKVDLQTLPAISIDFTSGRIDPRITTIRSTSASYVAANGRIVVVGNNVPRLNWDLNTGRCLGLLCEEFRTNLLRYSDIEGVVGGRPRDFETANDQMPVVSTDQSIGPNGMSALHRRTALAGDTNVGYLNNNSALTVNAVYNWSTYIYIPSTTTITSATLTVESGLTSFSSAQIGVANVSIRDRWQRIVGQGIVGSSTGGQAIVLRIDPPGAVVYSDCWQFERGDYASSWIPTTNVTSASRNDDQNYIYPFVYDPKGHSMYFEAAPLWTSNSSSGTTLTSEGFAGGNRGVFTINSPTSPAGIFGNIYHGYGAQFLYSGTFALSLNRREFANTTPGFATSGQNITIQTANTGWSFNTFTANQPVKFAYRMTFSETRTTLNGNTSLTATGQLQSNTFVGPLVLDRLQIGGQAVGGVPPLNLGGHVKKFSYYSTALSNNELIALTET